MEERRRRARLTPLSGELQAMVDYEPRDPTKEKPAKPRRERRAPTTHVGMIAHGLGRLALLLSAVGGAVVLVAWLIARHKDEPLLHLLPTAFYVAGAGVGGLAVLGGTSGTTRYRVLGSPAADVRDRAKAVSFSAFLAGIAIFLFALGLVLDYLL